MKKRRGITAIDVLKAVESHMDIVSKEFELDDAGKAIVFSYTLRLLTESIDLGVDIENPDYTDSMSDYLEWQLNRSGTTTAENVWLACLVTHTTVILEQESANKKFQGE